MAKALEKIGKFTARYRTALAVMLVIAAAAGLDYAYRSAATDYYTRGTQALNDDRVDDAISHFSRALRQNPSDPASRAGLAHAYQKKGWLDEALKQYEQSTHVGTATLAQSYEQMSQVLQTLNRREEATKAQAKAELLKSRSF